MNKTSCIIVAAFGLVIVGLVSVILVLLSRGGAVDTPVPSVVWTATPLPPGSNLPITPLATQSSTSAPPTQAPTIAATFELQPTATLVPSTSTPGPEYYRVAFVLSDDVLNVRSRAGVENPKVAGLAPNTRGVVIMGAGQQVGPSFWVPIQVDEPNVFFELASHLDIRGASVTLPHKSAVREYLSQEDDAVRGVGSCNTVYLGTDGFHGSNTDAAGFMASLRNCAGIDDIGNMAVTVIGAGGTSRAVVYALRRHGASVCIVNRTPERAESLADEFGCSWAPLTPASGDIIHQHSDVIVQTTSAGMHPSENLDPLLFYDFTGREIVYEVIYTPPETRLLERARLAAKF